MTISDSGLLFWPPCRPSHLGSWQLSDYGLVA